MEEILKELEALENQVKEFKNKYLFSQNNEIITAILNKLNVNDLVITYKELDLYKHKNYIAKYDPKNRTITISKYEVEND